MSQLNNAVRRPVVKTDGGGPAYPNLTPYQQLRRTVLACLLWEDGFYEDGKSVADRIVELSAKVAPIELALLADEARNEQNLRHVPLLLTAELAKRGNGPLTQQTIQRVIQRADEITEFMAVYFRNGKTPIAAAVKKGLAKVFKKFDAYQLAKYNREGKDFSLRDVMFMVHAKPRVPEDFENLPITLAEPIDRKGYKRGRVVRHAGTLNEQLTNGTLASPDTWEVELSAGKDKRETFERLIRENKLGYLALLRNLRNMVDAGVDQKLIVDAIVARKGAQRVLPFRYTAAARACPRLEPALDQALSETIGELPVLEGRTIVLVDVSGSMDTKLSGKSDLSRVDAAATLASIIHAENLRVFSFSYHVVEVPPRRGMAGVDAILRSQSHGATELAGAVAKINTMPHDRLIVITDEQSTSLTRVPNPVAKNAYMVNVASNKNGVGYGAWTHIDGFSENIIRYIVEAEKPREG